jgi:F0F1-type ATP synthase membrane subunit a
MNFVLAAADPMDEVLPHTLFHLGPYVFTNQMLMTVVAALLMVCIFPALFSYANSSVPTGSRNFFESILEFLRLEVFRPALKEHTDRFVPFLWTLFFFILFSNLLGQLPIAEVITLFTGKESHLGGTATGTPITTGALAICAFVMIHVSGVTQIAKALMNGTYGHHEDPTHENPPDHMSMRGEALGNDVEGDLSALTDPSAHYDDGIKHLHGRGFSAGDPRHDEAPPKMNPVLAVLSSVPLYLWNFAPHPFKPEPGTTGGKLAGLWVADLFMWSFLLILELFGALIKPFSLTIRLFANMIAGHIVLGSLVLMIPFSASIIHQMGVGLPVTILSLLIRVLELFVSFLQAYIFTFLATLFIASAVAPEH